MANQFGSLFRVTTFGESHGPAVGCVVDGCPPGVPLTLEDIQHALDRRRPGQSALTSERQESDRCQILSGWQNGLTLGGPIAIIVPNTDTRPRDYAAFGDSFRPGHADYTTYAKYGQLATSGGGRASARETVGRVAAGAVAKALCNQLIPALDVVAFVKRVRDIEGYVDEQTVTKEQVDAAPVRCPDVQAAQAMELAILQAKEQGDSLGGAVRCIVRCPPVGLGEPVFDKLGADLAKALFSIPACVSFEVGDGKQATFKKGSENNDPFGLDAQGQVMTKSNHAGGLQGGITNGMPVICEVGFKPVSSIAKPQETVTKQGEAKLLAGVPGRHDPCILPRAVPIVEAMVYLVFADHVLRHRALCGR